jgi:hypothetical protein
MRKRHEVEVLLKAGHSQAEVAALNHPIGLVQAGSGPGGGWFKSTNPS